MLRCFLGNKILDLIRFSKGWCSRFYLGAVGGEVEIRECLCEADGRVIKRMESKEDKPVTPGHSSGGL